MTMTPEQKLKWAILARAAEWDDSVLEGPPYPCQNVDELYDKLVEEDGHWDARSEVRSSGVDTGLPCEQSRNYESKAVAMKMPDGSWVGWTYFFGGGKHGAPEGMGWMEDAYEVECREEEKLVVVQTFKAVEVPA
jgi:hypothetical protein